MKLALLPSFILVLSPDGVQLPVVSIMKEVVGGSSGVKDGQRTRGNG